MANKITVLLDLVTDKAQASARGFKAAVAEAEGATNKFKAGASSALASVGLSAGTLAISAGTAIAAFSAKSVAAFQDTALAAGKFSEASGIAVQDASRLQEVASDLGVNTDALAGSMARFQKAVASGSPAVKQLGLEVVKTNDGQVDVNATFVEAIRHLGGVADANQKALLASQLFGKGFADSAELILGNADDIQKRLDSVSKAQIISPKDLADAKKFRDSLDNLQDSLKGLELTVGRTAVPVLSDLADTLNIVEVNAVKAKDAIDNIPGVPKELSGSILGLGNPFSILEGALGRSDKKFTDFKKNVLDAGGSLDRYRDSVNEVTPIEAQAAAQAEALGKSVKDAGEQVDRAKDSIGQTVDPLDALRQAAQDAIVPIGDVGRTFHDMVDEVRQGNADLSTEVDKLRGTIDLGSQLDDISKGFADITQDVKDFAEAKKKADDKGAEAGRKVRDDIRKQQLALLDLLDQYKQIPAEKRTQIVAEIATGDLDKLNQALDDIIGKDRFVHVGLVMPNVQQAFSGTQITPASAGAPSPIFQNPNPASTNNSQTTIIYPVGTTPTGVTVDRRLYDTRNGTSPR